MLNEINMRDTMRDVNAIRVDVEFDTNSANKTIVAGPAATMPILIGAIAPPCNPLYLARIKSAQKSFEVYLTFFPSSSSLSKGLKALPSRSPWLSNPSISSSSLVETR